MQQTCLDCGTVYTPRRGSNGRCPIHERRGRRHRSPSTRAQNPAYQRERKRILVPGATCHYCPAPATTVDHVIPVARGGGHVGNLVPCCATCNFSKGDRAAPTRTGAGTSPPAPRTAPPPSNAAGRGASQSLRLV